MDDKYYCIFKDEYDSYFLGEIDPNISNRLFFRGIQITKKNINTFNCAFFNTPLIKSISRSFHDSIMMILHGTRDEILSLLDNQKTIGSDYQVGNLFFIISINNITIINTSVKSSGVVFHETITINTDDFYTRFHCIKNDRTIELLIQSKELRHYYLDSYAYYTIEKKIHRTHQIVRNLLHDKLTQE